MVGEVLAAIPTADLPAFLVTQLPGSPWTSLDQLNADLAGPRPRRPPSEPSTSGSRGSTPSPDADRAWLRRYVRLWTARMSGLRGYAPAPRAYGGRIVLYPAPSRPPPRTPALGGASRRAVDGKRCAGKRSGICTAAGTHHTLVQEPRVATCRR